MYYIDKSREHLYDASTDAVNLVLVDSNDKLIQNMYEDYKKIIDELIENKKKYHK